MTAEIICVGTELLLGNIVNTNAAYLAEQLAGLGFSCYYQTVVGDNRERLLEVLETAAKRSEVILERIATLRWIIGSSPIMTRGQAR